MLAIGIPLLEYVLAAVGLVFAVKERRRVEHGIRVYDSGWRLLAP